MRTRPVKKRQAHWSKIMDFKPFHEKKKKKKTLTYVLKKRVRLPNKFRKH